jgi:chromosome segregation ATPase
MSISAISNSLHTQTQQNAALSTNLKQFQQEFQQLGQDLQSGNVSAAKGDLSTLQQLGIPGFLSSSTTVGQEFTKLSTQLQAGNVSGAEQDYTSIQQNLAQARTHFQQSGSGTSTTDTLLKQLGNELQACSQTTAQQAYATIQQNMMPFSTAAQNTDPSLLTGISLTA